MSDDSMYISTHEAALALVATSMKKARLRIDTLIINSFMGGLFFTTGGMFHVMIQAEFAEAYLENRGVVSLLVAAMYPIGLFYVIIMGTELFNSNILFFSVGVVRGAVSIMDLLISWVVSWCFNLIANIFVCYIIAHFSSVYSSPDMVKASLLLVDSKVSPMFHQTMIKGIAGNFFVALAVYLQIMAKPLHVKFILMFLPVFTFVSLGYSHVVADMFVLVIGLINGSPHSVGTAIWKVFIPSTLGNIIGGSFFAIVVPWYSHIYTVEQDQKLLNLPRYDLRDEQPEINADSRVVKQKRPSMNYEPEESPEEELLNEKSNSPDTSNSNSLGGEHSPPRLLFSNDDNFDATSRTTGLYSINTSNTLRRTSSRFGRSPKNVFPVYDMGEPLEREKSIATGRFDSDMSRAGSLSSNIYEDAQDGSSAEFVGSRLKRYITGSRRRSVSDIESLPKGQASSNHSPRLPKIQPFTNSQRLSRTTSDTTYLENVQNARNPTKNNESNRGPVQQPNDSSSFLARLDSQVSPNDSSVNIEQYRPTK